MVTRGLRFRFVALALLCFGIAWPGPAGARESSGGGGHAGTCGDNRRGACAKRLVRDYGRVFSRLPGIPRPRRDGRLSFGPGGIYFAESPKRILVPGNAGSHAFSFSLTSHGNGDRVFRLNWLMTARIVSIDARGESNGAFAVSKKKLGTVAESELGRSELRLRVPARPGLYRAEVTFTSTASGDQVGRVAQYLRVLTPRTTVRLGILGTFTVKPGESVVARVENLGTRRILSPEKYTLDRYEAGQWQPVQGDAQNAPSIIRPIEAGFASPCTHVSIPADSPSGLYRVVAPAFAAAAANGGRWLEVVRQFRVR
jgi:hypothetical protein